MSLYDSGFVQLALGLVFAYSFASKAMRMSTFLSGIAEYEIVPKATAKPVGVAVVGVEGLLAVSHLTGVGLLALAPCGIAVLVSFAAAVAVNLRRGRRPPCYCHGSENDEPISARTLARLGLMLTGEALVALSVGSPVGTRTSLLTITSFSAFVEIFVGTVVLLELTAWSLRLGEVYMLASRVLGDRFRVSTTA